MARIRRLILEYLVMVGVPICGILIVLAIGEGLSAAPPAAGRWAIEFSGAAAPEVFDCLDGSRDAAVLLRLTQSGRYVDGRLRRADALDGATLRGTIADDRLTLDEISTQACVAGLRLKARRVDGRAAVQLEGTLGTASNAVGFSATRMPGARTIIPEDR